MSDLRQSGSFESSRVDGVGIDADAVAIGTDGRVEIVTDDGRADIDHGERILDVALANRVIVLSGNELTAYSRDGERIWSRPAENAESVAAIGAEGLCGVLGPDRLRAVDIASGRERFDIERPRPGNGDDDFLAAPSGFVIATWSFLTKVTPDGEVGFDRDLTAVVRSIGRCDGTVVAALQSDQLVGIDESTGEPEWRTELEADHVAPAGGESLLVSSAAGPRRVGLDGSTDAIDWLSQGDVYEAPADSVICLVREGTVSTYVPDRSRISVDVVTGTVGVGGAISVEVTNPTEEERTVVVTADLENCSLSEREQTVTVTGGETTLIEFGVDSVRTKGDIEVELSVDGTPAGGETITVEDAASGGIDVETELSPTRIDDGTVELELTVENPGAVPIETVELLEKDAGTDEIAPGGSWTAPITRSFEAGRRVSVGIEVTRGERRREYAPTCTLPSAPTIDVDTSGETVRTTVSVDGDVTISDRLVIELPGAGRVRPPVTVANEELLLIVPQYESGTARIGFDAIDVEERFRISEDGPFMTPSRTHTQSDNFGREPSTRKESTRQESRSGRTRTEPQDQHTDTELSGASSPEPELSDQIAEPDDTPTLSATRSTEVEGSVVRDRIEIECDDASADVILLIGDDEVTLGPVIGTETRERLVASPASESLAFDSVDVIVDGETVETLPSRSVDLSERRVNVAAVADPIAETVHADIENRDDRRCQLLGVEAPNYGISESVDKRLDPGESAIITIGGKGGFDADAIELDVTLRYEGDTADTLSTVATVTDVDDSTDETGDETTALASRISDETMAAGEYGSAVLVLENEVEQVLSDVVVTASGESINETFYSSARCDRLEPGDRIEHFVDLDPDATDPSFEVTVNYAIDSVEHEFSLRASGPSTDAESEWTDEHLNRWSVEQIEEPTTTASVPDITDTLSTRFRRTGGTE
ncbi:PQQ-binding-like beta-propeller repeat protein [Natronoarchaeum rubrum]|uniref:PQQ-binding-like beta-propeller repeat protein n=1 Tax=Natronoarchaeum rubrum TaxID=755311 RepID=UPI0021130B78|nr:PQQ-binding-like beta-propeller repeat protein [Natronoarchaeum rubrum]